MPRWLIRVAVAVRSAVRRRVVDQELNEELAYHLHREMHEKLKGGLGPDEARRAAVRAMGPIEKSREECRDLRRGNGLAMAAGRVVQDARFALRLFRKHPAPVGIAIGGLALSIGVVAAVFSIVNATLLRPYGMDDPSSVVSVTQPGRPAWPLWPYVEYLEMRAGATAGSLEAARPARVRFSLAATSDGVTDRRIWFVSGGYMNLLGGRTLLGRPLGPSDDRPGAPAVIVVSHYFWRTNFDGDPAVVGRTVWVNGAPVTLVGVLQPGFTGPNDDSSNAIWATLAAFDDVHMGQAAAPTSGPEVQIVGRLSPGAGPRALWDNLAAILARPGASTTPHGASHVRGATSQRVQVHSAASPMSGPADLDTYAVLGLVFGITGLVLTLACANVANLLMASACTRAREVGVRLAMGATRRRVLTQLVTESVLMALVAGALGLLCAFWLVPVFARVADVGPELDLLPDLPVLFFTLGVALLCGLGAGLSPARFGARGHVAAALQAQGGTRRAGLPSRLRTSFVAVQAAVAMTLLVVAVLFTRSAIRMTSVEIGFDPDRLLTVFFDIPRSEFDEPAYVDAALAAVRRLPSVERVSVSQYAPFGFSVWRDRFIHEGRSFDVTVMPVDAEFFQTSGVRVLGGRAFTADEVADEAPVALISQSLARTFFRGHDPIGRSLSALPSETGMPQDPATIVGVAADALLGRLDGQQYGAIYRPLAQQRDNPPTLVIRSARPGATARAVEEAIRGIDPRVRATTRFVRQEIDEYLSVRRRLVWVFGPAAAMALVLAALGVYGVTAFVVGQRTEEVSVRMALGASATDVLLLLVSDSLRPIVIGLAVGLGLALAFSLFWAAEEMPGISPLDPLSIGLALTVLLAAALIAVLVPAGRAARADPAQLLRQA